tara:strand:- start:64 stop:384 length:321 start_codon:yes stop_codon:yes gene_type:complete
MSNTDQKQCESTDQKQCESTDQCETETQQGFTQVKTVYARAAIILLAINFVLTGYVLTGVMRIQDEQVNDAVDAQTSTPQTAATLGTQNAPQATPQTPQTLEKEDN